MSALDVRLSPSQLKCWQLSHVTSPILGSCVCAHSALLHQLMFSLPSGWHASHGDRGKPCPSALSVVPPRAVQRCTPLVAGVRVAVPDVPSALSVEPAMSRSSLRPLQRPVADCSARCTCLASQLMYAADAHPQANPAPAQGLPWHAVLHTSRLALHILTAGTLVAYSRAWPGHQSSVLNPLAPFSFVPPIAVGGRFYRARCLGVAFYLRYSFGSSRYHFVMGTKLVHPYSVLSPPCAVQHCTPPPPPPPPPPLSRQVAALQCSRDGLRLPTSMQVYA